MKNSPTGPIQHAKSAKPLGPFTQYPTTGCHMTIQFQIKINQN